MAVSCFYLTQGEVLMKRLSRLLAILASALLVACGGGGGGGEVILVPPVVIVPEQPMFRMAPQEVSRVHEVLAGSKSVPVYSFSVTESAPRPVFNITFRTLAATSMVINQSFNVKLLLNGADFTAATGVRVVVKIEFDYIVTIFPDGWQPSRSGDVYTLIADVATEAADRTPVVDFRLAIASYAERAAGFLADARVHAGKTLRIVGRTGYSLPAVLSTTPAQQMPQPGTTTVSYDAFFVCPVGNARQCNQKKVVVDVFGGTAPEFVFSGNVFPMTLIPGTMNTYEAVVDIAAAQSQFGYPMTVRTSVLPGYQAVTVYLKTLSTNIGTPEDLNPRMPNPCYTFASTCKG